MATVNSSGSKPAAGDILITRTFDAPRELVWKAWTEPERFMRWWGPAEFTSPSCRMDLRVGGSYLFCMRAPDGKDYWSTGVFREITPPERLVFTDSFADEQGNAVPASHYGMGGDWPEEILIAVTFEDQGGKTRMTMRQTGIPAGEMSELTQAGWQGSFDKLAESLKQE
jgi:uncharacterized protein YndB with AHSA1/START domain